MDIHAKDLKFLNKVRRKYVDREEAYDAILYYALTIRDQDVGVEEKLKRAIQFYSTPAGDLVYRQVHDHLSAKAEPSDEGQEIYEYSHELAKAAKHKDGILSVNPGVIPPEYFAVEALSRFNKRI